MKQKGFTLIELLAVIVVLAIIALIATPMVLNVIESARKGAAEASALAYADAVEQYIVRSMVDPTKPQLQAGVTYQLSNKNYEVASIANPKEVFINDLIEIKGDKPESGIVIVTTEGTIDKMEMVMNTYEVTCDGDSCEATDEGEETDEKESYKSYSVGDAVTVNGVGYHVIKSSGTKEEYVTLLRDESIGAIAFDTNGGSNFETSTLKAYLDSTYKATFGDKQQYIQDITLLDFGNDDYSNGYLNLVGSEEGTYTNLYKNYRDIFFTISSSQSQGAATECSYNEQTGEYDICTNVYTNSVDLFWTKTASSETFVIDGISERVNYDTNERLYYQISTNDSKGSAAESSIYDDNGNWMGSRGTYDSGVRPVIVISKEAVQEYSSYSVGDAVTIDGIGYHVTKSSGTKEKYVTLLRDESIGDFVFDENGGTDYETSTIKAYLDSTYKATFGDKVNYVKEVTLLELGEYETTYDENATPMFNTVLKNSLEGTMINLYQNYKEVFFSDTAEMLTKTIDSNESPTSVYNSIKEIGSQLIIWNVRTNGTGACGTSGVGCTVYDTAKLTPVRPVVVISKNALN